MFLDLHSVFVACDFLGDVFSAEIVWIKVLMVFLDLVNILCLLTMHYEPCDFSISVI